MKIKHLLSFLTFLPLFCLAQKQKVWLVADTGNEMDDLYAIARLVKEPLGFGLPIPSKSVGFPKPLPIMLVVHTRGR